MPATALVGWTGGVDFLGKWAQDRMKGEDGLSARSCKSRPSPPPACYQALPKTAFRNAGAPKGRFQDCRRSPKATFKPPAAPKDRFEDPRRSPRPLSAPQALPELTFGVERAFGVDWCHEEEHRNRVVETTPLF